MKQSQHNAINKVTKKISPVNERLQVVSKHTPEMIKALVAFFKMNLSPIHSGNVKEEIFSLFLLVWYLLIIEILATYFYCWPKFIKSQNFDFVCVVSFEIAFFPFFCFVRVFIWFSFFQWVITWCCSLTILCALSLLTRWSNRCCFLLSSFYQLQTYDNHLDISL